MKALYGVLCAALSCMGACVPPAAPDAGPVACGVIDPTEATCIPSVAQPDPAYTYFDCTVPGAKGDTAPSFRSKVPVMPGDDSGTSATMSTVRRPGAE